MEKKVSPAETVQDMLDISRKAIEKEQDVKLDEIQEFDEHNIVNEYGLYAALKYATLTVSCPFKNAIILQQIGYNPSDYFLYERNENVADSESSDDELVGYTENDDLMMEDMEHEIEEMLEDTGDEDDDDALFEPAYDSFQAKSNRIAKPQIAKRTPTEKALSKDKDGYIISPTGLEQEEWFRLGSLDNNILHTVLAVCKHPDEGFFSLWKGQFTSWFYDMLYFLWQPTIEGSIDEMLSLESDGASINVLDSVGPNLTALMVSEVVTGWMLSPLEAARTRLVAQSSASYKKKYHGVFHTLKTMIREEGLYNMYFGINFLPTLLYHAITPISKEIIALTVERLFQIDFVEQPVRYLLCESLLGLVEFGITLPLQTVRRRLQCQIEPKAKLQMLQRPFNTIVSRSSVPYTGMYDCFKRMVMEEGGKHSVKLSRKRLRSMKQYERTPLWNSYGIKWGLDPLYGGVFQLGIASKIVKLLISLLNIIEIEIEEDY